MTGKCQLFLFMNIEIYGLNIALYIKINEYKCQNNAPTFTNKQNGGYSRCTI